MRRRIFISKSYILLVILIFSCQPRDMLNIKAKNLINQELAHIEEFLNPKTKYVNGRHMGSVLFLEQLTNIESESPGNYIGKYRPTVQDLEKWKEWYAKNKLNVLWMPQKNKIGVQEKNPNGAIKIREVNEQPWIRID